MAQENDDANGQLVRQRRWIQEARLEVRLSPIDRRQRLRWNQLIRITYIGVFWSCADVCFIAEPMT